MRWFAASSVSRRTATSRDVGHRGRRFEPSYASRSRRRPFDLRRGAGSGFPTPSGMTVMSRTPSAAATLTTTHALFPRVNLSPTTGVNEPCWKTVWPSGNLMTYVSCAMTLPSSAWPAGCGGGRMCPPRATRKRRSFLRVTAIERPRRTRAQLAEQRRVFPAPCATWPSTRSSSGATTSDRSVGSASRLPSRYGASSTPRSSGCLSTCIPSTRPRAFLSSNCTDAMGSGTRIRSASSSRRPVSRTTGPRSFRIPSSRCG